MSRYDDDFDSDGPEESEDTDPTVRELRAEIIRLEAQLDQLSASVRERAAETAVIQAQIADLEVRLARLEARRKRDLLFLRVTWVMIVLSIVLSVYVRVTA
jgi:septal ring factor EnvC (AmiA/AmiB activator)